MHYCMIFILLGSFVAENSREVVLYRNRLSSWVFVLINSKYKLRKWLEKQQTHNCASSHNFEILWRKAKKPKLVIYMCYTFSPFALIFWSDSSGYLLTFSTIALDVINRQTLHNLYITSPFNECKEFYNVIEKWITKLSHYKRGFQVFVVNAGWPNIDFLLPVWVESGGVSLRKLWGGSCPLF